MIMEENKKRLEFYGGAVGGLVPFLIFLAGTIYICVKGAPTETGMALFALIGLLCGAFLLKTDGTIAKKFLLEWQIQ